MGADQPRIDPESISLRIISHHAAQDVSQITALLQQSVLGG